MELNGFDVLDQYKDRFQPTIPWLRQGKYVQIVLLRETKSHAIFTTEGPTLDVERLQAGLAVQTPIDRLVMYKRKQVAPERRTGKALMRQYGILPEEDVKGANGDKRVGGCQLMGSACGVCPDCVLYGFAATAGTMSQRSRVLTDSAYSIREHSQIMRNIKLNAVADTTAGGVGSAYASRENVIPQVFLPSVETLVDVTQGEFVYVLGNILKTTRYGAEVSREGFVRNHVLGIYFSDVEIFSNLELTQRFYDLLAVDGQVGEYLKLSDFTRVCEEVIGAAVANAVGVRRAILPGEMSLLMDAVADLYGSEEKVRTFLQNLNVESASYERRKTKKSEEEGGE